VHYGELHLRENKNFANNARWLWNGATATRHVCRPFISVFLTGQSVAQSGIDHCTLTADPWILYLFFSVASDLIFQPDLTGCIFKFGRDRSRGWISLKLHRYLLHLFYFCPAEQQTQDSVHPVINQSSHSVTYTAVLTVFWNNTVSWFSYKNLLDSISWKVSKLLFLEHLHKRGLIFGGKIRPDMTGYEKNGRISARAEAWYGMQFQ